MDNDKLVQAAEDLLVELDAMTDEELVEALENVEDRSLSYAMNCFDVEDDMIAVKLMKSRNSPNS